LAVVRGDNDTTPEELLDIDLKPAEVEQRPARLHSDKKVKVAGGIRVAPRRRPEHSDIARTVAGRDRQYAISVLRQATRECV
jgi:hypothetical protein